MIFRIREAGPTRSQEVPIQLMKDCLTYRKPIRFMRKYFENKLRGNKLYALGFNHLHFQSHFKSHGIHFSSQPTDISPQ